MQKDCFMIVKKNNLTVVIYTILIHVSIISYTQLLTTETSEEKMNFDECKQAHHEKLKHCFKTLSSKERVQLFEQISFEQKKEFLKRVTMYEYEEFLDDFNEYDWQRIVQQIPEEERHFWPKTVYGQRIALIEYGDPNKNKQQKQEKKDEKKS